MIDYSSLLIRRAALGDLAQFVELAAISGKGITNLPKHEPTLRSKILESESSFKQGAAINQLGNYLFFLENTQEKSILGCSGILTLSKDYSPVHHFKVSTITKASPELKIQKQHQILTMVNDYHGATELGSLYLHPKLRAQSLGAFISKVRFLFMAEFQQLFNKIIIAELRGVLDKEGNSSFWDAIGRKFIGCTFNEANDIRGTKNKQFIADLMPQHPIYTELLPQNAQNVIGKVHPSTIPAFKMLEKEGFRYKHYVDIFDAGPIVEAEVNNIPSIVESRKLQVTKIQNLPHDAKAHKLYIISNCSFEFRAVLSHVIVQNEETAIISPQVAQNLKVNINENIRVIEFKRGH